MKSLPHPIYPVIWQEDHVILIDQTKLPLEYIQIEIKLCDDMVEAIRTMIVRGAPAIGVAAGYGMYLGAREITTENREDFLTQLEKVGDKLRKTRPTAVNLFWAIARMLKVAHNTLGTTTQIKAILLETAQTIQKEDLETCQAIGNYGLTVFPENPEKLTILTHCNAGALATAGYGTALGVIRSLWQENRLLRVYADETRPRLQGAKLTAWECVQEGIPVTVITDNMSAHCMQQGMIDGIVVGADRIAKNGDTANKIGTYGLAVIASHHRIPFYVAAPISTIDFNIENGEQIPIEQRHPREIYQVGDTDLCPTGVEFYNPAFDVTPASLITGIITEKGVFSPAQLGEIK
jgi:methylthioribose-1-phosphate isomerase